MEKKKSSKGKKALVIILCLLTAIALFFVTAIIYAAGYFDAGNRRQYDVENVDIYENSPMQGMHIAFLGSSVTVGATFHDISFAEYLAQRHSFTYDKEAVSGTTLAEPAKKSFIQKLLNLRSYVDRLKNEMDPNTRYDAFICQLSTNDASLDVPLGDISESYDLDGFDTSTITGAMEYIICYARQTWSCPVIFYTGTQYGSAQYAAMVERLLELREKWQIGVIDMWNAPEMQNISEADYEFYMHDNIHPTKAGYMLWWTPYMETRLCQILE